MSLTASIAEIIGFFLAAKFLKLFGTNLSCIIILLAFTIRFGGYYFIRQPYFLIAMETMHFFNFGILYVLIAQKADSIGRLIILKSIQLICFCVFSTTESCGYTSRYCSWSSFWFR